jgi:CHAT domain-containing protein
VDESIHLTSAFQLAGFQHVIGTLWEVEDRLCVDMAKRMYEFLRDKGVNDESVSQGLHHATRALQDGWVHSEEDAGQGPRSRDVILCQNTESRKPLWVPYIHFGV